MKPGWKTFLVALIALVTAAGAAYGASNLVNGGPVGTGCQTYGAVGTSSVAVNLPAEKQQFNYVATVMADDVPNEAFPQGANLEGAFQGQWSLMMNPASYANNDGTHGVILAWTTLDHVAAPTTKSVLQAVASNTGGVIRLTVWGCPLSSSGTH